MNVDLARAAIADARAHIARFNMFTWYGLDDVSDESAEFVKAEGQTVPPCGTTACFGGFAALRVAPAGSIVRNYGIVLPGESPDDSGHDVMLYARKALELTPAQARVVFFLSDIDEVEKAVNHIARYPAAGARGIAQAAGVNPDYY